MKTRLALAIVVAGAFSSVGLAAGPSAADIAKWNTPVEPFKVFGNTYYVGTAGLSSILIASKQGLILLDGALPQSAPRQAPRPQRYRHAPDRR